MSVLCEHGRHEPSLQITRSSFQISEYIASCKHCGTVMTFEVIQPGKPHLRLVYDNTTEPVSADNHETTR